MTFRGEMLFDANFGAISFLKRNLTACNISVTSYGSRDVSTRLK